jgi:hypothetical protein
MYLRGVPNPMKPMCFTINPSDNSLWLGATPNGIYNVSGECWIEPTFLVADADTPPMPAKFHTLIVLEAMKRYAGFEAASEVMQRAMTESLPLWTKLEIQQLPPVTVAGAWGAEGVYFHG